MSFHIENSIENRVQDTCIVSRFVARVHDYPTSVVACTQDQTLTMRELGGCATRISDTLHNHGTTSAIVGVFAYPGFHLLSGLWGVLLSGNAYCPLSPDYPEDRLRYMIESAQMTTIICEAGLEKKLRDVAGEAVRIVTPAINSAAHFQRIQYQKPDSSDLAYVIFTSGSTGRPKGVMIEHENIWSQMAWFDSAFDIGEGCRILQKTPFSFDAAQWELLASAFGAVLVFGSREGYRNPFEQIHLIKEFQVTMLQCVPTLWRALIETERLNECTSLNQTFSGGEALSRELARNCKVALPNAELINLYGPTECTINATWFRVTEKWLSEGETTAPIGYPAGKTKAVVIDDAGCPQPNGESGEILIGGPQVGRGYLNNDEATAERFMKLGAGSTDRFYRTGDIGRKNPDGSLQFLSRVDGQIKLRGYRIELDEIRNAIENHDWVKTSGVFVAKNQFSGADTLVACVELSPNQAQLMDASTAGDHHRSKGSKLQLKAQISGLGLRQHDEISADERTALPGKLATVAQQDLAFSRKSYRHFEGARHTTSHDVANLLRRAPKDAKVRTSGLSLDEIGVIMRNFGQFESAERLLPKYTYASPGALYATQIYLSISGISDIEDGLHYYHPSAHALYRVGALADAALGETRVNLHFVGKSRAISHVYKLNVREVLDFEVGHILGVFDEILPEHGFYVGAPCDDTDVMWIAGAMVGDFYLGGFSLTDDSDAAWAGPDVISYVQSHRGSVNGMPAGLHRVEADGILKVSDQVIEHNHVIAINQQVYHRSSFGVGLCVPGAEGNQAYIALGRRMQNLQMAGTGMGFMSSGYSSRTGEDQRAATRFFDIMSERVGAFYFGVGGRISEAQKSHRGMKEDMVHSKGPLELIKDDLKAQLPDFMVPHHIVLVDAIPLSANGKLDMAAMRALVDADTLSSPRDVVLPRTALEREVERQWRKVIGSEDVSVLDSFFDVGGDSLGAVKLVMYLNEAFCIELPLEAIFEAETIADLAVRIANLNAEVSGRLVPLATGSGSPIFCWPGLGGYPMGLRDLAAQMSVVGRPVIGVQAFGLNATQVPDKDVVTMAARDVIDIRNMQPNGPYTLIGYSFGARVAFEAAGQLEAIGETVDNVILVAPGSPKLSPGLTSSIRQRGGFENPDYVAVLISVLTRRMGGAELVACLETVRSKAEFITFIMDIANNMPRDAVARIMEVAIACLDATYDTASSASGVLIEAPVTVFKASGDEVSFLEMAPTMSRRPAHFFELPCDHFRLLMPGSVDMLGRHIVSYLNLQATLRKAA